ncbi:MAG: LysM peptidoglycan-binding domain-containing protein [Rhodothermales bacterium]
MKARYTALLAALLYAGIATAQDYPTHTVQPGETLYRIATTNGMSVDSLKRLNHLSDNIIRVGQVLILAPRVVDEPSAGVGSADGAIGSTNSDGPPDVGVLDEISSEEELIAEPPVADPLIAAGTEGASEYVVQEGETLYSIAAHLGTKAYILFTMNGGIRDPLLAGQTLLVPRQTLSYQVRSGDTLSGIARRFGVSVADLRRANRLTSDVLEVGRRLTIPGSEPSTAAVGQVPRVYAAGEVRVFPNTYAGRTMANGEEYDPADYVVSHRELPFDTILLVENPASGVVTFARVADRGPLDEDDLMDVSEAVALHLGLVDGRRIVRVRLVE